MNRPRLSWRNVNDEEGNSQTSEPWNGNERTARRAILRSWKEKLRLQIDQLIDSGLVIFSLWTAHALELRLAHESTTSVHRHSLGRVIFSYPKDPRRFCLARAQCHNETMRQ